MVPCNWEGFSTKGDFTLISKARTYRRLRARKERLRDYYYVVFFRDTVTLDQAGPEQLHRSRDVWTMRW